MSILASAALGAMLVIGPTTPSMAQVTDAQSGTGDASLIFVRGGGGGGHGGGGHGFGGGHSFSGGHDSGGFGHGHFAGDRGFRERRDGGFWDGDRFCYPDDYHSYDPYFCG